MTLTEEEIKKMRDKRINNYVEFDLIYYIQDNNIYDDIEKIEIKGDQAFWLEKKGESVNFQKCPCYFENDCYLLIVFNKNTIIKNLHFDFYQGLKELQKYVKLSEYVNIYTNSEIIEIFLVSNSYIYTHEHYQTIKKDLNRVDLYTDYEKTGKKHINNFKDVLINWFAHTNNYYEYFLNEIHYFGNAPTGDKDLKEDEFYDYIVHMFETDDVTRQEFNEYLKELKN